MAANDKVILESNFASYQPRVAGLNVDPWLFYCIEQIVKPFDLSDEEILYGITDGSEDGGADAIYFLANRMLIKDDSEVDRKMVSRVRLLFIQVKRSGGFKSNELNKFVFLADDFLDLSKKNDEFATKYNPNVLKQMKTFKEKYLAFSGHVTEALVDFYYVTGDDAPPPDAKAKHAVNAIRAKTLHHLNKSVPSVEFVGAQQLWERAKQRPARDRSLQWAVQPLSAPEGHVGLVKLSDYYKFLQNETGELEERIFESNVRGYQHGAGINKRIQATLGEPGKANFWLMNNGITIISTDAQTSGYMMLTLRDPQIVNGLQTSREVFAYFANEKPEKEDRTILVRVISTRDPEVADQVIRATNSQNRMQESSLRMTDPIHRKIEDIFKPADLYYDRQKGYYKGLGMPAHKIVSATALAQAMIAILLQRPDDARARPGDYFKEDDESARYNSIYSEDKLPLPVYLTCIRIVRRVQDFLESKENLDRVEQRNLLFYVSAAVASDLTSMPKPPAPKLVKQATLEAMTDAALQTSYSRVRKIYAAMTVYQDGDAVARGPDFVKRLQRQTKKLWNDKP